MKDLSTAAGGHRGVSILRRGRRQGKEGGAACMGIAEGDAGVMLRVLLTVHKVCPVGASLHSIELRGEERVGRVQHARRRQE